MSPDFTHLALLILCSLQAFGRAYAVSNIKPPVCGEGEYVDWFSCKPCEYGTFMTRRMAESGKYPFCHKCYQPAMYEIVVEPCTKTRDTTIKCDIGYYRSHVPGRPYQSECITCDVCGVGSNVYLNYETVECEGFTNTVCSYSKGGDVVNHDSVNNPIQTENPVSLSKIDNLKQSEQKLLEPTCSHCNAGHLTTSLNVFVIIFLLLLPLIIIH